MFLCGLFTSWRVLLREQAILASKAGVFDNGMHFSQRASTAQKLSREMILTMGNSESLYLRCALVRSGGVLPGLDIPRISYIPLRCPANSLSKTFVHCLRVRRQG